MTAGPTAPEVPLSDLPGGEVKRDRDVASIADKR
jgi:hypothetical protein